jgi:hypothetical protein
MGEYTSRKGFSMLTERQQSIFNLFLQQPDASLSMGNLLPHVEVGRTTLFRDLTAMVGLGLLLPDAPTRARTYRLNPLSTAYLRWDLSRPPQQRPAVPYNPQLLENYQPNQTYLLSSGQRTELMQAGNITDIAKPEPGKNYTRLISTLLIDLAHASSNLENVPISWLDTKTLLEFGERPDGLDETQLRIVLNHKTAINHLTTYAGEMSISRRDLFDLHALIADGLIAEASAIGTLRNRVVRFSDSRYMPPDNPHLLNEAFETFCGKASEIADPYEQAFFCMTFVPYLQPFQDGNKRTSRLAMNIPLLKNFLAPFSFTDLRKRDYMFGLLAFYERGQHSFLAEAFVEAYRKTAPRYAELLEYVQGGGELGTLT